MTLRLGEVVLIRMQFHEAASAKVRPAVVLLDTGDSDFVAALQRQGLQNSISRLPKWRPAGLNVASSMRIHKLSVLAKSEIARTLGTLTDPDRVSLVGILCRASCPQPERE